jgi:hypothetical protein
MYFEEFSELERDLLASLPWRAGLWVSRAEQGGGAEADEAERSALEKIITAHAQGSIHVFVQEIIAETLKCRTAWASWGNNNKAVPEDCKRAVAAVVAKLSEKEAEAFRAAIMDIGLAVARAFSETEEKGRVSVGSAPKLDFVMWMIDGVERMFCKLLGLQKMDDVGTILNVSSAEGKALAILSAALRGK